MEAGRVLGGAPWVSFTLKFTEVLGESPNVSPDLLKRLNVPCGFSPGRLNRIDSFGPFAAPHSLSVSDFGDITF